MKKDCRSCTIVAADVLDSTDMIAWVKKFKRYAPGARIWGLHNYKDANDATGRRSSCSRPSRARSGSPRPAASCASSRPTAAAAAASTPRASRPRPSPASTRSRSRTAASPASTSTSGPRRRATAGTRPSSSATAPCGPPTARSSAVSRRVRRRSASPLTTSVPPARASRPESAPVYGSGRCRPPRHRPAERERSGHGSSAGAGSSELVGASPPEGSSAGSSPPPWSRSGRRHRRRTGPGTARRPPPAPRPADGQTEGERGEQRRRSVGRPSHGHHSDRPAVRSPRCDVRPALDTDTATAAGLAGAQLAAPTASRSSSPSIFARVLGREDYGVLAAALSTFLILSVPGVALQVAASRAIATRPASGARDELRATLDRWTRRIAARHGDARGRRRRAPARAARAAHRRRRRPGRRPRRCRPVGLWLLLSVQRGVLAGLGAYRAGRAVDRRRGGRAAACSRLVLVARRAWARPGPTSARRWRWRCRGAALGRACSPRRTRPARRRPRMAAARAGPRGGRSRSPRSCSSRCSRTST